MRLKVKMTGLVSGLNFSATISSYDGEIGVGSCGGPPLGSEVEMADYGRFIVGLVSVIGLLKLQRAGYSLTDRELTFLTDWTGRSSIHPSEWIGAKP